MATDKLLNRDSRCEDYDNDPAKSYHAHDLPRCKDQGTEWYEGRWVCARHAERRRDASARRQGVI